MKKIKTQVGIIGAGPAGLFLAHWLKKYDVDAVILERRSREYVEGRVRAGLLEQNTVEIMKFLGLADRLEKEGIKHEGVYLSFDGRRIRVPFGELTNGRNITIYGQQEVVKDLTEAWLSSGGQLFFNAQAAQIDNVESSKPSISFRMDEEEGIVECDFVAACDGYYSIGRETMPSKIYNEYQVTYPFSWLGILASVKPSTEELIYAYHEKGFALHSMRSETVSRLYLQVANDDDLANWPDDRIWEELSMRLGTSGWHLNSGAIIDKSITPMRSFMIDKMQFGKLFLAGDAAHIVPPTGGKGLNLAVADIKHLAEGFIEYYHNQNSRGLDQYTELALKRVWRAQDFSHFMTQLFHKQVPHGSFEYHLQKAKFDYIDMSKAYSTSIAENYVGMPFETFFDR